MHNLCVIPAKLYSRRFPFKNIKLFFGEPIIYYSIKTALESKLFSKVFVSTDSLEIANYSKKVGADVDFLRPKKLAEPRTTLIDVVSDTIKRLERKNFFYDYVCCFLPIAPLVTKEHLKVSLRKLLKSKFDFIFPASSSNGSNQNSFSIDKDNKIKKIFKKKNLKLLKNLYFDTGQFYWGRSNIWKKKTKIIKKNKSYVIFFDDVQFVDVNYKEDWKILKKIYKKDKYVKTM